MSYSSPGDLDAAWRLHHAHVVNLAYQMIGDLGEAEDVAQEAFLRLSRTDLDDIDDVRGWLIVVAGRLCLDQLRSARVRRETPLESEAALTTAIDPADRVTLDDQVSLALTEVLSVLTPGERVAFVLHDVFAVPFNEIAQTLGRPVGTCRQLARRARTKFTAARPDVDVTPVDQQRVTDAFIAACASGDLEALTAVLDPTVWGVGRLLTEAAPPQINHGPHDVAVNLLRYLGPGTTLVSRPAPSPTVLAFDHRRMFAEVVLTVRDGRIVTIEATVDPAARQSPS